MKEGYTSSRSCFISLIVSQQRKKNVYLPKALAIIITKAQRNNGAFLGKLDWSKWTKSLGLHSISIENVSVHYIKALFQLPSFQMEITNPRK